MSVKLVINSSEFPSLKPGVLYNWDMTDADLVYATDRVVVNAIVVKGNSAYRNGRKLKLYFDPAYPTISPSPNKQPL